MVKLLVLTDMVQNGQALVKWLDRQQADSVMIASDTLANDSVHSLQLRLQKPRGMRMAVKELSGAVALLESEMSSLQNLAVVTERLEDAKFILKQTAAVDQIFWSELADAEDWGIRGYTNYNWEDQ